MESCPQDSPNFSRIRSCSNLGYCRIPVCRHQRKNGESHSYLKARLPGQKVVSLRGNSRTIGRRRSLPLCPKPHRDDKTVSPARDRISHLFTLLLLRTRPRWGLILSRPSKCRIDRTGEGHRVEIPGFSQEPNQRTL